MVVPIVTLLAEPEHSASFPSRLLRPPSDWDRVTPQCQNHGSDLPNKHSYHPLENSKAIDLASYIILNSTS